MPPVESCVGYLEPIYFYKKTVFILNGFLLVFLFILCYLLNNKSILSGILACLCYFYNHGEATRVMWTPALRESFSFPFHLLQTLLLTVYLKSNEITYFRQFFFILATVCFILTWQFAQFSLATQLMSLFAAYALGFLSKLKFVSLLKSHSVSLLVCYGLMFANRMLITSLYASLLGSLWLLLFAERIFTFKISSILHKIITTLYRVIFLFVFLYLFKKYFVRFLLQNLEDDSHIWDILKSKFDSNSHTFDTRLYTCAKEFDFIEQETFIRTSKTLLLPLSLVILVYYATKYVYSYFKNLNENENDSQIVYNMFQVAAYTLMACMIMRLKLFWIPHLCIIVSLIGSDESLIDFLLDKLKQSNKMKTALIIIIVAIMSYQGVKNLKQQHEFEGEYSDYALEQLMNWTSENTKLNDSFAGSMPLSANLKLSTNRRIINHPHYEDIELRNRIKIIYSHLYGYRPVEELHSILKNEFKTQYLVIERHYCLGHPPGKPECAMPEIAHIDMSKTSETQACARIIIQDAHAKKYFLKKFQSSHIAIFKII